MKLIKFIPIHIFHDIGTKRDRAVLYTPSVHIELKSIMTAEGAFVPMVIVHET